MPLLSSQDAQNSDSPAYDSQPNDFTLDPLTIHQLPADINETTDMGQQGGEELVPEGEYDVLRQAIQSFLGWFHSSGDNADDFLEENWSLIPTDEVLKDKITWDMQASLKGSLTYCAKIYSARSLDIRQDRRHTFVCSSNGPEEQVPSFLHRPNMLGKEHFRLKVDKFSEYQPTPPELAFSLGLKAKVHSIKVYLLQTEELMRRAAI